MLAHIIFTFISDVFHNLVHIMFTLFHIMFTLCSHVVSHYFHIYFIFIIYINSAKQATVWSMPVTMYTHLHFKQFLFMDVILAHACVRVACMG